MQLKRRTFTLVGFFVFNLLLPSSGVSDQSKDTMRFFGVNIPPRQSFPLSKECVAFIQKYKPTIRANFNWSAIEFNKGEFEINKNMKILRSESEKAGAKFAVVLAYNHPLYAPECREELEPSSRDCRTQGVDTEQNIRAFERYVHYLVQELGSEVALWEVWNEPNVQNYWKPGPSFDGTGKDFDGYMVFLKRIAQLIKRLNPNAFVVSGGTAAVDFDFIQKVIDSGACRYIDAIGIHMNFHHVGEVRYREKGKRETMPLENILTRLDLLYSNYGVPFVVTEFGFPLWSQAYTSKEFKKVRSRTLEGDKQIHFFDMYNRIKKLKCIDGIFVFSLEDTLKKHKVKQGSLASGDKPVLVPAGLRGLIDAYGNKKRVLDYFTSAEQLRLRLFGSDNPHLKSSIRVEPKYDSKN